MGFSMDRSIPGLPRSIKRRLMVRIWGGTEILSGDIELWSSGRGVDEGLAWALFLWAIGRQYLPREELKIYIFYQVTYSV
jgi:hypothetical protein